MHASASEFFPLLTCKWSWHRLWSVLSQGVEHMTLRYFLTVASVIAFAFGVSLVLITGQLTSRYNVALNAGGVIVGQLFGAALIGFGVLNWLARTVTDAHALRAILLANLVGDVLGFVVALLGQLAGVGGVNQLGWSTVAIYLLLALGFAYFQFVKPGPS